MWRAYAKNKGGRELGTRVKPIYPASSRAYVTQRLHIKANGGGSLQRLSLYPASLLRAFRRLVLLKPGGNLSRWVMASQTN